MIAISGEFKDRISLLAKIQMANTIKKLENANWKMQIGKCKMRMKNENWQFKF